MRYYFCLVFMFSFVCIFTEARSEEPNKGRYLFPVARNGKIGFIDQSGKIIIPCEYSMYTCPEMDGHEEFLMAWQIANDNSLKEMDEENSSGYFCYIPYLPENGWSYDGIIPIVKNGKVGFLRKDGTIVVEPQYTGATHFRNGRAWVSNEKEYLFLDDTGTVLMDGIEEVGYGFTRIKEVGYYSGNGVSKERRIDWTPDNPPFPIKKGGKWGFMDWSGKLVVPCQFDDVDTPLYGMETLVCVDYRGRKQLADYQGNIYDYEPVYRTDRNEYLLRNRKTGCCAIYNGENGWITSEKYYDVGPLSEGLRRFKLGRRDKYGYMDENENVVIPPKFNYAFKFHNGLALVGVVERVTVITDTAGFPLSGIYGYINKKGEYVWEPSLGPIPESTEIE